MDIPNKLKELLPSDYSYRLKKWTPIENEPTHFECILLTNIYTEEEAQQWWHNFNIKSNTTMRVRATCPKTGKINTFKIYLRCLHQGRAEKQEEMQNSKTALPLKRNTHCPAGMIIAIRRVIKYSQSKMRDPVDPVHPCEIHMRFVHNHPTSSIDSLRFRPVSKTAEDKLLQLFELGHSPSSALGILKIDLQIEHGPFYSQVTSDRSHCPDKSFCYRLYYKHFRKEYTASDKKDIHSLLTSKISNFNKVLGEECLAIGVSGNEHVIAICTPLMKRGHTMSQSGGSIYVELHESPSNKYRYEHFVLLFIAHTCAGAVPLGALLATSKSTNILTLGLQLLKQLLPEQAFFKRGSSGPHAFFIEDSENLKIALNCVWCNSVVVICILRILQTMWRWLWHEKNSISEDHRLYLLYLVKTVLFAPSQSDIIDKYEALCADSVSIMHPTFLQQVESLWQRRQLWGICFHKLLPLQGATTYYEAAVRALKDKIFEPTKSFNIIQLLDYLVTRLDFFYKTKFLNILQEKVKHVFLSHFPECIPNHIEPGIKQITGNYFIVPCSYSDSKYYNVDAELNICSCPNGIHGALCIHQYWIFLKTQPNMFKADISDGNFRKKLFNVASGLSCDNVDKTFTLKDILAELTYMNKSYHNSSEHNATLSRKPFATATVASVQPSKNASPNIPNDDKTLQCNKNCSLGSPNSYLNISISSPELFSNQVPAERIVFPHSDSDSTNSIHCLDALSNTEVRNYDGKDEVDVTNSQDSELKLRMTQVLEKFEKFCERVKDGLKTQPEDFVPALEVMMKNVERKCSSTEQIISGLTFFGIISDPSLVNKGKKRPATTLLYEEIVPKVFGRHMFTYEKKKSTLQDTSSAVSNS